MTQYVIWTWVCWLQVKNILKLIVTICHCSPIKGWQYYVNHTGSKLKHISQLHHLTLLSMFSLSLLIFLGDVLPLMSEPRQFDVTCYDKIKRCNLCANIVVNVSSRGLYKYQCERTTCKYKSTNQSNKSEEQNAGTGGFPLCNCFRWFWWVCWQLLLGKWEFVDSMR